MLVESLSLIVSDGRQHWGMTGQDHCQIRCQLVKSCKKEFAGAFHTAKQDVQATSPFKNPPQGFFCPIICCNWMFSIDLMTTVRDRINAHLPIVLEVLRTGSLVVIALSTICASQSLKQMAGGHDAPSEVSATHKGHK